MRIAYTVFRIAYNMIKFLYEIRYTLYQIRYTVLMANLSDDDVRHIAKLARLNVSDKEVKQFAPELSAILDFVGKLQEVDTAGVEPTPNPTGIVNRFRDDEIVDDGPSNDDLLGTSPLPIVDHQIQTPSAHGT